MFRKKYNKYFNWGVTAFLVIIASITFFFLLFYIPNIFHFLGIVFKILTPILWGLALAYLLTPIVKRIENLGMKLFSGRVKNKRRLLMASRWAGILLSLGLLVACVVFLLAMILPEIGSSIANLYNSLPEYADTAEKWISGFLKDNPDMQSMMMDAINHVSASLQENLGNLLRVDVLEQLNSLLFNLTSGIIGFLKEILNLAVGLIVSTYVMSSRELFCGQAKKILYALIPRRRADTVLDIVRHSNRIFGGFITGKLLDSLIIGILCFICISILRMPYIVLISVVVGVTNVIPFFGPFIGGIPCTLLVFLVDPRQGIIFGLFILALQQLDGNIIGPKILGNSTGLSAFWVVFSILLGGGLFGFLGMVFGVPTFAVLYYLIKRFTEHLLMKHRLPVSTSVYQKPDAVPDIQSSEGSVSVPSEETASVQDAKDTETEKENSSHEDVH